MLTSNSQTITPTELLRPQPAKLRDSNSGTTGIKQFFYDFLEFTKDNTSRKGCLVCNTVSELGNNAEEDLMKELLKFTEEIKLLFINNIKQESKNTKEDPTSNFEWEFI